MVIIRIMGGLGNQMYQYALYQKFLNEGKEACIDLYSYSHKNRGRDKRKFLLDLFPNINYLECSKRERRKYVDDNMNILAKIRRKIFSNQTRIYKETIPYEPEILQMDDVYLQGYWNCEKYYLDMIKDLRNVFSFPEDLNQRNTSIAREILETQSVSLHIRRGDYLSERHAYRFGSVCSEAYYDEAIRFIKSKIDDPHFFVFSDDVDYIKKNYNTDEYTIIDWNNTEETSVFDMKLMSMCKHNICANSTFSKWAAFLNKNDEKIKICPLKHTIEEEISFEDRKNWWPQWTFIDDKGQINE